MATWIDKIKGLTAGIALAGMIAGSGTAQAFMEDVCYRYRYPMLSESGDPVDPAPYNCFDMQGADGEGGGLTGMLNLLGTVFEKLHARSTIHFDATWLLARMSGLTSEDADTLADYDQATDLGVYVHYDWQGDPIEESRTDDIDGVTRMNTDTFGGWLHYVPWYQDGGVRKAAFLTYNRKNPVTPFSRFELPLNHLRDWAFGRRASLCTTGLTDANGACFDEGDDESMYVALPAFGPVMQEGSLAVAGQSVLSNGDGSYDADYDEETAGTLKSFGIYLHAMADRVSHDACTDKSPLHPAEDGSADDYELIYAQECGTVTHLVRHYRETGHGVVPARTRLAVRYVLWEIQKWMREAGYAPEAIKSFDENTVVDEIASALGERHASDRVSALCQIARHHGLDWHDGNETCVYP